MRADARRGAAAAVFGCASLALTEWVLTLLSADGPVRLVTALRFLGVDVALVCVGALVLVPAGALVYPLARRAGARLSAPWLWGGIAGAIVFVVASSILTVWLSSKKDLQLLAATLALLQLPLLGLGAAVAFLVQRAMARLQPRLPQRFREWNPLASPIPALLSLAVVVLGALPIVIHLAPRVRSVFPWASPWRDAVALSSFALGFGAGTLVLSRRGRLWPADRRRQLLAMVGAAAGWLALVPASLLVLGADPETKYLATSASPTLSHLVGLVRVLNDVDRDGYGTLLGENDCAPFDARIHPGARDVPDNGTDENCSGVDFSRAGRPSYKTSERMPVPPEFQRDWNFLLITIDTVRYDHTSFGGYPERADRRRDTTPRLAELAARSVSFDFANAPSAGTMASVPAILTSRFFHSGIALAPSKRKGDPPILKPENTTIPEVVKRAGYRTGAILTHEWFNDWGMEQGVDDYDNSLGAKPDPYRSSAPQATDKAIAWIARQGAARWLLWIHYIDPHGRYVAHPGDFSFGTSEEDLYDGELAFADKHVGRLLDAVSRGPVSGRTVVFITSDHGDGFNEHGFINHGMALYRELLHVPLIVYVPDAEPQRVEGAVSPLDILPTIADLAGVDVSDLTLEGESLVPQLFHGQDATGRVVFAETNYPDPLRAVISHEWKLIYNMKSNLHQLYDLTRDPWEKKNVWREGHADGARMKGLLDDWLDRVYYSRDPGNQAQDARAKVLLPGRPSPRNPAAGVLGEVELLGWDSARTPVAGPLLSVDLYVHAKRPTQKPYEFHLSGRHPASPEVAKVHLQPADGLFPTTRWQPGDFLKLSFPMRIPPSWVGGSVELSLTVTEAGKNLGEIELGAAAL